MSDADVSSRSQLTVLLIDDSEVTLEMMGAQVERLGFAVQTADGGEAGLRRWQEGGCDLVVCDVVMPGVDGAQVLRRLKEQAPDLPVIMLSSYAEVERVIGTMRLGADDYVLKDGPDMVQALEAALGRARRRLELVQENRRLTAQLAEQARAILELSTPVVQLWDGVLAVPLIGGLESSRADQMLRHVLQSIAERAAQVVIIDTTGVPHADERLVAGLVETARAARLVGADCVLTGLSPHNAMVMSQTMEGAELSCKGSLQDGLRYALDRLGLAIAAK